MIGCKMQMHRFEAEGVRPRGRPKRTYSEVTEEDC